MCSLLSVCVCVLGDCARSVFTYQKKKKSLIILFLSIYPLLLPCITSAVLLVAVVTGLHWLLRTRPSPSPRPSAFWRARPRSGACTPSFGKSRAPPPPPTHSCTSGRFLKRVFKIHVSLESTTFRNKETSRDEFIFYSKRLMRLLIERALSFLPSQVPEISHLVCFDLLSLIPSHRNPNMLHYIQTQSELTWLLVSPNRSTWSTPLRGRTTKAGPSKGRG